VTDPLVDSAVLGVLEVVGVELRGVIETYFNVVFVGLLGLRVVGSGVGVIAYFDFVVVELFLAFGVENYGDVLFVLADGAMNWFGSFY